MDITLNASHRGKPRPLVRAIFGIYQLTSELLRTTHRYFKCAPVIMNTILLQKSSDLE